MGLPKPEPTRPALYMGESGILLVLWRVDPNQEIAGDLHALVIDNLTNPANDVMWGTPGTFLAARLMYEWTDEDRWADAARRTKAAALAARDDDGLWANVLHGESYRGLGPFHGATGNALVLGLDDLGEVLREHAVVEGGLVNWPTAIGDDDLLLQWCAGGPGIVTCGASYLDEDLLLGAAELAWQAGPSGDEKGSSLCHGTAGTGWAFLKAFERDAGRPLAGAGSALRRPRARAGAPHAQPLLALDRRRRRRPFRRRLPGGAHALPGARKLGVTS